MTHSATRLRFLALVVSFVLPLISAGLARGQNIIAQWSLGGETFETSSGKDLSGRSGIGWEASTVDPNVTAANAFLSDSLPPSNEDYIEFTAPAYQDDSGNDIPVLRFETGNNSNNAAEASAYRMARRYTARCYRPKDTTQHNSESRAGLSIGFLRPVE